MFQQSLTKHEQRNQAMHEALPNPAISNTENAQRSQEFQCNSIMYDIQPDSSQPSKLFESPSGYSPRFLESQKNIRAASSGGSKHLIIPSAFHSNSVAPEKSPRELQAEYKKPNLFGDKNNDASRTMEKDTYRKKNLSQYQVSEVRDLPMEASHRNCSASWKEKYV